MHHFRIKSFITLFILLFIELNDAQPAIMTRYIPGRLYIKLRPGAVKSSRKSVESLLARFGAINIRQAFHLPVKLPPQKATQDAIERLESIRAIQLVSFPESYDMEYIAAKLTRLPEVEYAEPVYMRYLHDIPDDPYFNRQDYLNFINAPGAWDIAKGDSTVVMAIVDTGVDFHHPDLRANLWTNPGEIPDNGIDDDENGYIDDVHGWDFYGGESGGDNDPSSGRNAHGTHVAGIAAAVTNNGIGIASLSYNVRFMPVKIAYDSPDRDGVFGNDGILYAASNGAHIINLSFGGPGYLHSDREIIQFAQSMGCLIISSAGNDGDDIEHYPSGYPEVISVGSVEFNGVKSSFSSYGYTLDVTAPGSGIYSTVLDGRYESWNGTSMSSPVVAALAVLVKSAHMDWNADRIRAQIVATASSMTYPDPSTAYLSGTGYVNAEKALGEPVSDIEVISFEFTDSRGNRDIVFSSGVELKANLTIKNFGKEAQKVVMKITPISDFIVPVLTEYPIGDIDHAEERIIEDISFLVGENPPLDKPGWVRLDFEASDSTLTFSSIVVRPAPLFGTLNANNISLSADSKGHIGYIDYPNNMVGSSFIIQQQFPVENEVFGEPFLFEGGLMLAANEHLISDAVRGINSQKQENDFIMIEPFKVQQSQDGSIQRGVGSFTDEDAPYGSYNILLTLEMIEYGDTGHDQYVVLKYNVKNQGEETITGMRLGLFLDFDLPVSNGLEDYGFYNSDDDILAMAVDGSEENNRLIVGATILDGIYTPCLINNADTEMGTYDGFTDREKWISLSRGLEGPTEKGPGDISMVISGESFTLIPEIKKEITIILAYGFGYNDMTIRQKVLYHIRHINN